LKTRPTVFLSHSSQDKEIIEKINNDLRSCRVDAWYAEWEIPAGQSFRRQIFEDGIPNCDCFFVYLSDTSIESYWVKKELDAAFIEESRDKNVEIITFVADEQVRGKLSSDLAALHSPVLNLENYEKGLRKLLVGVFEAKIRRTARERSLEEENERLRLENELSRLKQQSLPSEASATSDVKPVEDTLKALAQKLKRTRFKLGEAKCSALRIFERILPKLMAGAYRGELQSVFQKDELGLSDGANFRKETGTDFENLMAPLVIHGLVRVEREKDAREAPFYIITALGSEFARVVGG
jgi:hypothetical protein